MDSSFRDYMSREEREQMDVLIDRARKRKERRKEAVIGAKRLQFDKCLCACQRETGNGSGKSREEELEQMLKVFCDFCLRNNLCQCPYHRSDRQMEEWEAQMELEEIERHEEMLTGELPF